jgi:hypothetical protein
MLQFKHLAYERCPYCKSKIRSCSINGTHANGEQFETVEFDCFCLIRYSPNFSRINVEKPCPNSTEEKNRIVRIACLVEKIEKLINEENLTKNEMLSFERKLNQKIFGFI